MSVELTIPKLGMTMKEATINRWAKSEGDWVESGEILLVIETEKITYEMEAPAGGYLHIIASKGAKLPVGAKVGILFEDRASYGAVATEAVPPAVEEMPPPPPEGPPPMAPQWQPTTSATNRVKASPLARSIARKHGIDMTAITGTGPGGRIIQQDVLGYLKEAIPPRPAAPAEAPEERPLAPTVAASIPIEGMRRQIFQHMHRSLQETAQITLTSEVDATEFVRLRQSIVKKYEKESLSISYNDILVRILTLALREHPNINATVDGESIVQWKEIHIGVAMELDDGLIVPVVRNADTLSVREIHEVLQDLFQRARNKKLLLDDIQGGTFTLTSLGHLGIDAFTPILNRPQSGILGVGRVVEKPAVVSSASGPRIDIRSKVMLSLTVDHRIIDGAPAARFLRRVGEMIEEPYLLVA